MLLFSINDVKSFMNVLFKEEAFTDYNAIGVSIKTYTDFDISCINYNDTGNNRNKYLLWRDIRPFVFEVIKGKTLPKLLKISLSVNIEHIGDINSNAAALHITFKYENGVVKVLTGCAQKVFQNDKLVDIDWDNCVLKLFERLNIAVDFDEEV